MITRINLNSFLVRIEKLRILIHIDKNREKSDLNYLKSQRREK